MAYWTESGPVRIFQPLCDMERSQKQKAPELRATGLAQKHRGERETHCWVQGPGGGTLWIGWRLRGTYSARRQGQATMLH